MILYFDNYITDEPFYSGGHEILGEVRNSNAKIYKMPSKLDITLYTLASYAEIKWTKVIIKYELQNINQKEKFEIEVLKLFPKAKLIYGRSDSQKKFQETINYMNTLDDDWIFYAGNNDHPFMAPNLITLNSCLTKAKEIAKKNWRVSIALSHFTEFYNKARKGTPFHEIHHHNSRILKEEKNLIVSFFPKGIFHSMQIVNKKLFNHWFFSGNAGNSLIRRSECIEPFAKKVPQILIIPKNELCAHFDGEIHTIKSPYNLPYDLFPPLFIPQGFFENKVKINYGYENYKDGWVNINPLKEKYSFRDSLHGTDMKIGLEDLPLFWKRRISKIVINNTINKEEITKVVTRRNYLLRNYFPKKSRFFYLRYRMRNKFFVFLYKIPFIRKPIKFLLEKSNKIRNLQLSLIQISLKNKQSLE